METGRPIIDRQPTGGIPASSRYDQLMSPSIQQCPQMGVGAGNPCQIPPLYSPIWPIDSVYETGFVTASYCPETPQTLVTAQKPAVSFDDDDVVIPPSGTVDPAKIVDDDKYTDVETCLELSDEFVTAPHIQRTANSTRPDRKMLPRRRDKIGKSLDNRIAIGANSDGFPVGVRSDRRTRDGVNQRIERAELFRFRNMWLHVLRRPSQRSLLSERSEKKKKVTTATHGRRFT